MDWLAALAIFIFTYALISIRRIRRFKIERPAAALLGAALMVLLAALTPSEALEAVKAHMDIIVLLLGMMFLVAALELCGFFDIVALYIMRYSKTPFRMLALIMVITAVLSALILNDAVVLLFTPIVIKTCRLVKADPVPYMVAEAISANIGSMATPVGNPQNAYIATMSGISFTEFATGLAPLTVACLAVGIILLWFIFKKDFTENTSLVEARMGALKLQSHIFCGESSSAGVDYSRECEKGWKGGRASLYLVLAIMAAVFVGFVAGYPIFIVAIIGGTTALFSVPLLGKVKVDAALKRVDWSILLFFAGLFVLLAGVEKADIFTQFGKDYIQSPASLSLVSAFLSNLISNVPATMLVASILNYQMSHQMWLSLAASSTLAGNATILGAAANIIVAEVGLTYGVEMGFWKFAKAGMVVTIVTLILSIVVLA